MKNALSFNECLEGYLNEYVDPNLALTVDFIDELLNRFDLIYCKKEFTVAYNDYSNGKIDQFEFENEIEYNDIVELINGIEGGYVQVDEIDSLLETLECGLDFDFIESMSGYSNNPKIFNSIYKRETEWLNATEKEIILHSWFNDYRVGNRYYDFEFNTDNSNGTVYYWND